MKKNKTNIVDKKVLIKDTSSSYSEAFQQLQVNLDFSFIGEKDKVIAITSPLASDGKSTVCANLAYIYSKKNYKVLVIDLDLRRPSVHRFFDLTNDIGVTDYCTDKAKEEDIIKHYENIDIITSGSHTPFPGKVLESEILLNLINSLKEKYDIILVDTPPVLLVSDALICSKFVSQYIVTVTYAETKKADFEETMRQLKSDNKIKIAGVVFNKKKYKKDSYDYKNKYY